MEGQSNGGRPTGTVTFLFTDIEGSTQLWEHHPGLMAEALEVHDRILRETIEGAGGTVFTTAGDSFAAAFSRATDAADAAAEIQGRLSEQSWPEPVDLAVRIGLHTGVADERDGDYFGPAVNRAARIMSAAHGTQTLVSDATANLIEDGDLVELGEFRLKDLGAVERLHQLGSTGEHPPLRTLDHRPHNLPAQRGELLGRKAEIANVAEMLAEHRLVTLLGIGGTGKTRLAMSTAAELIENFPDGVWFVDLVPAGDSAGATEAIANAAGLRSRGGADALDEICRILRDRQVLVVLDNCEHIIDDVAEVVDEMLNATESPRLLCTSREPLELADERRYSVPTLSSATAAAPAVDLLLAAADRVGADVSAIPNETARSICEHLDGLPLAIELAGAQLRHVSAPELAERLDQRFDLLQGPRRGRGRRHASLIEILNDTWAMLDPAEQQLLSAIAAFPASFDLTDVEGLCEGLDVGVVARGVAGLVDRSLLVDAQDGRHRLLETVRLFVRQQWTDPAEALDRHTDWCLRAIRAVTVDERLASVRFAVWVDQHLHDLRVAEDRCRDQDRTAALCDLLTAHSFAVQGLLATSSTPIAHRALRYLDEVTLDTASRGRLELFVASAGLGSRRPDWMADYSAAAEASLQGSDRAAELAQAKIVRSWMLTFKDTEAALALLDEAAVIAGTAGAELTRRVAVSYRFNHLAIGGRHDEAWKELDAFTAESAGVPFDAAANNIDAWTITRYLVEDPRRSLEAADRSQATRAELDASNAGFLIMQSCAVASVGDLQRTVHLVEEANEHHRLHAADDGLPDLILPLAVLAWRRDEIDRARTWLSAIRHAGRPTKSFLVTSMFRAVRAEVGMADPPDRTIEETYAESLEWLHSLS